MRISVFGLGYVGTVSAACLAEMGHTVVGVDVQEHKIEAIRAGRCPLIEPGLPELVAQGVKASRLSATSDADAAVLGSDLSFICVGTPSAPTGAIQLGHIRGVCQQIGKALAKKSGRHVIAVRSTIMPGAVRELVIPLLEAASGKRCGRDFGVCTHPEFLREGSAVKDFRAPPMIVIGQQDARDGDLLESIYGETGCPKVRCSGDEAMMVKYACNAYHATKVTFGNEIGALCGLLGLDSHLVMDIFCKDTELNISRRYLKPSFAFGGSCLPKDLRALLELGHVHHLRSPLLESIMTSNAAQIDRAVDVILGHERRKIGVLGLSFKDETDDLRESPVVEVVERLIGKGRNVKVHDTDVQLSRLFGSNLSQVEQHLPHVASLLCETVEEVVAHAELVVVAKGSQAYRDLPARLGKDQIVIDLVRLFQPREIRPSHYRSLCG
ncbi:MAG TPA: UDP-glucose/GDP-mannose dehydrogenase family protein [Myxococcales bacterium]|nr:UDP-glucose/GDP-mannose dehydrogenase family protein [Myxococcales bacterium]